MKPSHRILFAVPWLLLAAAAAGQTSPDAVIDEGRPRLEANQQAQQQIDQVHSETRSLLDRYQSLLTVVEDLKIYNELLARQIRNQESEIADLNDSIANAAVIERQILPLLSRMLDSLERYIAVDLPFLREERSARVAGLRRLIDNPGLTNAEKTRRVFEAFQVENDYGNTIEAYRGQLDVDGRTFDVDYFRVGRVSLTYRTVGADEYGYWNDRERRWETIRSANYKRNIDKGIRMARQEMAPEMITVPVANAGRVQP